MKQKKLIFWIPVTAWALMIFMFSAQNASDSTQTSSLPAEILVKIIEPDIESFSETYKTAMIKCCQFIVRKLAHFSVYTVLGMLTYNAFRQYGRLGFGKKIAYTALLCAAYAVSDEVHQYFVPGRSCRVQDVMIDSAGILFGIMLWAVMVKLYIRIRRKRKKGK